MLWGYCCPSSRPTTIRIGNHATKAMGETGLFDLAFHLLFLGLTVLKFFSEGADDEGSNGPLPLLGERD